MRASQHGLAAPQEYRFPLERDCGTAPTMGLMIEAPADEGQWIARSRAGDVGAFNRLVETYQDSVYNLCLRMLAAHEPAEDATQDTFVAAFRNIGSLRGDNFRAWLFRIASNMCRDELRRRRRRNEVRQPERPDGEAWTVEPEDPGETPEGEMVRGELRAHLQAALLALPADQRLAIILCDMESMSYEEIAACMGRSMGTVKSRISRGRSKLRALLKDLPR